VVKEEKNEILRRAEFLQERGREDVIFEWRQKIMDNELIITGVFLSAGLLAYVIIPGLLVMWDRVLDHMEQNGSSGSDRKP
jgi:hypothetical protein